MEVGRKKFKGVPCPTVEEAQQSAAAIANSNMPVSDAGVCSVYYVMKRLRNIFGNCEKPVATRD